MIRRTTYYTGDHAPGVLPEELDAWRIYLARTRAVTSDFYEEREQNEWRRLKGRLARLRITDDRRIDVARERSRGA